MRKRILSAWVVLAEINSCGMFWVPDDNEGPASTEKLSNCHAHADVQLRPEHTK